MSIQTFRDLGGKDMLLLWSWENQESSQVLKGEQEPC